MTAEAFRRWYKSRNLTQKQVAGLLGIAQGRVSDMATGKSPVSRQTQRQIFLAEMVLGTREFGGTMRDVSLWLDRATFAAIKDGKL